MSGWINFKDLRTRLDFAEVLKHYGVDVKRKGDQHLGFCPLPSHQGNKNSPSFSANLVRGIFQCFGCGAKGNVLEFAAYMERVNPQDGAALRQVALRLERLISQGNKSMENPIPVTSKGPPDPAARNPAAEPTVIANEPLDFELKGLEPGHPYLLRRGFTAATIAHFGLGFCSRGMLKDRLAVPLHDNDGRLIGYAGRVVDDAAVNEENPRYRFPGSREREGRVFEFRKSLFLYNGFRIKAPAEDLIVVEGFPSVWWLHQHALPEIVATMGSDCSERQAELIISAVKRRGRIWLLPDGDTAGGRLMESLLVHLLPHRFVRWIKLDPNRQPTDLSAEQLKAIFAG